MQHPRLSRRIAAVGQRHRLILMIGMLQRRPGSQFPGRAPEDLAFGTVLVFVKADATRAWRAVAERSFRAEPSIGDW